MKTEEKKAQHTPGPWKLCEAEGPTFHYQIQSHNRIIANLWRHYDRNEKGHKTGEIDEANARLISACPEMLAALEAVVAHGYFGVENQVRAAIAKAKGDA